MGCRISIAVAVLAAIASSQDLLHYKFESPGAHDVVNYAAPVPGIPSLATFQLNGVSYSDVWGSGRFGSAYSPSAGMTQTPTLDTGWDMAIGTGEDVTIAFFMRVVNPIPASSVDLMRSVSGNTGNLNAVIASGFGGQDYGHIYVQWDVSGSGGPITELMQDVLTPAYSGWVHVALVIDRAAPTSGNTPAALQWYVDGVAQPVTSAMGFHNMNGSAAWPLLLRGMPYLAFDEFRVALRAVPHTEIMQWATIDRATDTRFGDSCAAQGQPALLANVTGSTPYAGNLGYGLRMFAPYGSPHALVVGLARTPSQDLGPLVNGALAGCLLHPRQDVQLPVVTVPPVGYVDYPFPIPFGPSLAGLVAYAQAVGLNPWTGDWFTSNAVAAVIGDPPPIVIAGISPLSAAAGQTVTVSGNGFLAGLTMSVGGAAVTPLSVTASEVTFVNPAGVPCGSSVVVTNPNGQSASIAYNANPVVTNTLFSQGPTSGGTTFIILGNGYAPGTMVTIGGAAATVNSISSTVISVTTPPGPLGPASVVVTTPGGCTATTTFNYQ